jgi:hypothetical protein
MHKAALGTEIGLHPSASLRFVDKGDGVNNLPFVFLFWNTSSLDY